MLKDKVVREATQFLYNLNTVRYELEKNKIFQENIDAKIRLYMGNLLDELKHEEDKIIRNFIANLYQILDEHTKKRSNK